MKRILPIILFLFLSTVVCKAIMPMDSPGFFREGRTYWYGCSYIWGTHQLEFGLKITGKEIIDGKEWNRIDMVKRLDYNPREDKIVDFGTESIPVAYIREEDGKIYRRFDNTEFYNRTLSDSWVYALHTYYDPDTFCDPENVLYGFGPEGFQTKFDDYFYEDCIATVLGVSELENSGRTYKKYTLSFVPEYYPDEINYIMVVETIGVFGYYDKSDCTNTYGYIGTADLLYHPFRPVTANGSLNPWLRYVTEGDDNTIIFEWEGGDRFWEYTVDDGVESINSDSDANVKWFNLQGVEIPEPVSPGIYIKKAGSKVEKLRVK